MKDVLNIKWVNSKYMDNMKIVILDGYTLNPGDISWDELKNLGDLTVYDRTTYDNNHEDLIVERVGSAQAIFTNKTPLSRAVLIRLKNLKFIGVLATGYNIVDIASAKEFGITVTNIPTYGTDAVSQMAIALLLELCHRVGEHSQAVKNGEWMNHDDWCFWNYPLIELVGKTAGIIGFGRIGRCTEKIAVALGMKILAYDKYQDRSLENEYLKYAELDELFKNADVIFLHCPLMEETRGIINKDTLAKMKDGVMIINNARGSLIVERELTEALITGKVAGAAVDVVSTEPIRPDNPLLKAGNCLITPHISWAPREARNRLLNIAVHNLKSFMQGKPENVVNA